MSVTEEERTRDKWVEGEKRKASESENFNNKTSSSWTETNRKGFIQSEGLIVYLNSIGKPQIPISIQGFFPDIWNHIPYWLYHISIEISISKLTYTNLDIWYFPENPVPLESPKSQKMAIPSFPFLRLGIPLFLTFHI